MKIKIDKLNKMEDKIKWIQQTIREELRERNISCSYITRTYKRVPPVEHIIQQYYNNLELIQCKTEMNLLEMYHALENELKNVKNRRLELQKNEDIKQAKIKKIETTKNVKKWIQDLKNKVMIDSIKERNKENLIN
jgi:hypothetical protein